MHSPREEGIASFGESIDKTIVRQCKLHTRMNVRMRPPRKYRRYVIDIHGVRFTREIYANIPRNSLLARIAHSCTRSFFIHQTLRVLHVENSSIVRLVLTRFPREMIVTGSTRDLQIHIDSIPSSARSRPLLGCVSGFIIGSTISKAESRSRARLRLPWSSSSSSLSSSRSYRRRRRERINVPADCVHAAALSGH